MFDALTDKLQGVFSGLRGRGKLTDADIDAGDARDPPVAARGRRQPAGGQAADHGDRGARQGRRGDGLADPRPAGREDRERGAHDPHGRGQRRAAAGVQAADHRADGRPPGLRQDDLLRQARAPLPRSRAARRCSSPATSTGRPPPSSSRCSARRSTCRCTARRARDAVAIARNGIEAARKTGRDLVIVDTAGRLTIDAEMMDELVAHQGRRPADERRAGHRRDDRPDGGRGGQGLRRGGRLRRRRAHQARRRRPRRRRPVGAGGQRQADPVHRHRREARGARALPPGPDGVADPRDGRRPQPDREGPADGRRRRRQGARGEDPRRLADPRGLPRADAPGAEDGADVAGARA